MAKLTNLFFQ